MISLSIRLFPPASRDSSCSEGKRPENADWRPLANAAEKSLNVQFADESASIYVWRKVCHSRKWNYSNSGYVLLGYLIEKITGDSYEKFVRENIFVPFGN